MAMNLLSPAFHDHGPLPDRFTCEGSELSPPLRWEAVPSEARALALVMEDPDSATTTLFHWIVFNLSPALEGLPEGAEVAALDERAREGMNDRHRYGYLPPCPGAGQHRYIFRLYALDGLIEGLYMPRHLQLESAVSGHILEYAELTAYYECSD